MKFGVNYPLGPFEWAKKTSLFPVYLLLNELFEITKEPRYRPSLLLKKLALKKEITYE